MSVNKPRCQAQILKQDCLRVVRGRGFKMHYTKDQCSRKASCEDYCKQHSKASGVVNYKFAKPYCD